MTSSNFVAGQTVQVAGGAIVLGRIGDREAGL